MSATGRSAVRRELDNYPTPAWCVRRLLERVDLPGGTWLDPCAGDGAIIRAARPLRPDVSWAAVEIREACRDSLRRLLPPHRILIDDFVNSSPPVGGPTSVVIGNPPFSMADAFIRRTLESKWARVTCFLLRLNFLAGGKRSQYWSHWTPDVYVLPNRPSFVGEGKTDSCEYAWFVWHARELPRQTGHVSVLDHTPLEERNAPGEAAP